MSQPLTVKALAQVPWISAAKPPTSTRGGAKCEQRSSYECARLPFVGKENVPAWVSWMVLGATRRRWSGLIPPRRPSTALARTVTERQLMRRHRSPAGRVC